MRIILDVGSNWETKEDLYASIIEAKKTGADYVKFQAYQPGTFYLKKNEAKTFPIEEIPSIHEACHKVGIKPMFTIFDSWMVDEIDPYVNNFKVSATEITNYPLLSAIGKKNKRVYLSVPFPHVSNDIIKGALNAIGHDNVVLMYCVVDYPSRTQYVPYIETMRDLFPNVRGVGFSDHSIDIFSNPAYAAKLDAFAIEKHFAYKRFDSPDMCVSLLPDEAKEMVSMLRGEIFILQPSRGERCNLLTCLRKAVAIRNIKFDEHLLENINYRFIRSDKFAADSIGPHEKENIEGIQSIAKIDKGELVMPWHLSVDAFNEYIRKCT